jgi:hypothetical protein
MRYDTCRRRGIVTSALTDFEQQGTDWFMRGDLAVDSGSTRLYGSGSDVTSCDVPEPHYHFSAGQVKWLNRNVMVARPAVLYIRDVPVLWMPFIFQDIRSGRRSGMLVPRFGVNDLVRTSGDYRRHVANVGYYLVVNDYLDVLGAVDWSSGNYMQYRAQASYRLLTRFLEGTVAYTRINQLDDDSRSTRIGWNHRQRFSSRSSLNVGIDYATSTAVIQQNTINPFLSTAQLNSSANFDRRFSWGALNIGGTYQQNLQNDVVSYSIPSVNLTPSPVNIGSSVTWSPGLTFRNSQTLNNPYTVEGLGGVRDTVLYGTRNSTFGLQTPLRIGRWNWTNAFLVTDVASDQQRRFVLRDSAGDPSPDTLVFARTFSTGIDWQTGINLPQLFSGSWKLQPGVSIVNTTGAGPFMVRNQFSNGEFVLQGKRPQFNLGMRPTLFGFFPGVGPLARIRHSFSPVVDYRYAPGAEVPEEYRRVIDPEGLSPNSRTDPQQTISMGLSQSFEGKLRTANQDSAQAANARKLRLLTINTSSMEYNFEAAKQPGRSGWQTQRLTNSFSSDLLPGFQLSLAHNLWDGPVGYDSTRFDPFLENVSASFQVTASTMRAFAGLFGIAIGAGRREGAERPPEAPQDGTLADPSPIRGYQGYGGYPAGAGYPGGTGYPGAFGLARGGGRGFSLGVQYSSSRTRPTGTSAPAPQGGQRNLNLNMGFSPTRHWSLSWTTNYDIDTERFGQHYLRFERDLHRWTASFAFVRSPNGNVAFNFYISLTDLPDIKFDYDQQTY